MSKVPTNLIPTRTLQLPQDPSPSVYGYMAYVRDGVNYRVQVNDVLTINGVPVTRQVIAGTGLYGGGPLSSDVTLGVAPGGIGPTELANTGVTAGTYGSGSTSVQITVDAQGRIDSITTQPIAVTGYVPDTRYVYAGDGLTGGGQLSNNITIDADYSSSTPLSLGGAGAIGISNYLVRGDHQHPAVDLSDDNQVDNILGMDNGGTGNAIVPVNGSLVYSGADALYLTPSAGTNQVPYWDGSGFLWASTPLYVVEPAHTFWAGPTSGPDAFPSFRAIVASDVPTLNQNTTGTASNVTGIVAIANGGTGQSTASAAFNALSPVTATGDLILGNGANSSTRLPIGTNGYVLTSNGTTAAWQSAASGVTSFSAGATGLTPATATTGAVTLAGTLAVASGGTGATTAPTARSNLGAAASGANTDITSMSGVTTSISSPTYIQMGSGSGTALAAGRMWYDQTTGTWNMGMGGGAVTQQVGEELYRYGKASAAITDSPLQLIYKTGTVGASGVITFAPAVAGITDSDQIIGCATETIALNGFGRVTTYGVVNNINTTGSVYGETWTDNTDIYYNPVTGGLTKNVPIAPGIKVLIGTVINAGSGGSGSFVVKLGVGASLNRLADVQLTSPLSGALLVYDATLGYWRNNRLTAGTNVSITNGAGSVTINATDQYVGTVTSVAGTGTVNGITLTGTVTSSGSLTLGGTLSNVSLTSQVTGTLPLGNGGTGGTSAATARTSLGAAASGANTDITSVALTTGTITTAPTSANDIVNKTYVDGISAGINFHQAVRLATAAALAAYTYNNGSSGVGATITASANGALTVDGVAVAASDRVMIKNEVSGNAPYNGVYVVTQTGSGAAPFILTRATDYNTAGTGVNQINQGDFFLVTSGSTQANTSWVQQTPLPITVGTTAITFTQFAAPITYSAGTGLTLAGTVFSITNTGVTANTYGSASSVPVLAINAQGQVTSASSSSIAIAASQITSGTLLAANGGTGNASYAVGDLLYASGATALSRLAAGTANYVLMSNGVAAPSWTPGTISGVQLGSSLATLTLNTSGTGLSGSTTYNGSGAATFTVTSNATAVNTASTVVARDATGNFAAGTIAAALNGNATTATTLQTARTINGVSFDGSANITVTAAAGTLTGTALPAAVVGSSLTSVGTLTTGVWNATAIADTYLATIATAGKVSNSATTATALNTASAIVARDVSGNFAAGTITAALSGNASTATSATTATNLAGGAANRIAYQTGAGATSFVAAPTVSNTFLKWDGTSIAWAAVAGAGTVTSVDVSGGTTGLTTSGGPITASGTITLAGTLAATNGGTGQTSYAVGDLVYASTTTALSKLADVATGNALISGGVGVAPSYGKVGLTTHVSGTLPVANGGTGVTTSTGSGALVLATSPSLSSPTLTTPVYSGTGSGNGGTSGTWTAAGGISGGTF